MKKKKQAREGKLTPVEMVARNLSHEFGNILLQIIGTAELRQNGTPEEMARGYETILKTAHVASHINKNFKNLLAKNRDSEHWETLKVSDVLDEAIALLEHVFTLSHIRIVYVKKDEAYVKCVKSSLIQVFVNLLINAYQAMNVDKQEMDITHSTQPSICKGTEKMDKKIELSVISGESSVEIRIRDYGKGVDEGLVEKVVHPFFTTKEQGEGLGLSVSKEIVEEEYHGSLNLRNHGTQGFEVIIKMPSAIYETQKRSAA